jgi:hypothetical protein
MAVRERHSNTDIPSLTQKMRRIIEEVRTSGEK